MTDNNPKKINKSKKQRRLTPQELGMHEMKQVYQQLQDLMDLAFGDEDDIDEEDMTDEQSRIVGNAIALEEEWIIDPIKRAKLSVIQFDKD